MTIEKKITNILFYYIKDKYKKYLSENSLRYIDKEDVHRIVSDFYNNDEKEIKTFIRETLKKMIHNYPGPLVENLILEIFSDKEIAINRVCMEVHLFQESNKDELDKQILNNSYEVYLTPDVNYGLGLSLNLSADEIIIVGFKNGGDNKKLPAEQCDLIKIGDRLLMINDNNIDEMGVKDALEMFKNISFENKEITLKLLNKTYI